MNPDETDQIMENGLRPTSLNAVNWKDTFFKDQFRSVYFSV